MYDDIQMRLESLKGKYEGKQNEIWKVYKRNN